MKKSTTLNKLNALLGLTKVAEEVEKKEEVRRGNTRGIPESEIQEFREIQGLIYFLQAPALFQAKICKHCGSRFIVSRLYVAFCSYKCIQDNFLREFKIPWRKGRGIEDIEKIIHEVYEDNEPIWVRQENLDKLYEILTRLRITSDVTKTTGTVISTSSLDTLTTMTIEEHKTHTAHTTESETSVTSKQEGLAPSPSTQSTSTPNTPRLTGKTRRSIRIS